MGVGFFPHFCDHSTDLIAEAASKGKRVSNIHFIHAIIGLKRLVL